MRNDIYTLVIKAFSIANYRINALIELSRLNRKPASVIKHNALWCVTHDRALNGRNVYLNDPKRRFSK